MLMAYAAKRSVIARLVAQTGPGGSLEDVQVTYGQAPEPERQGVYGGRVRSVREQVSAEHGVLFREVITVELRIRVAEPGDDVQEADRITEGIANAVSAAVSAEPRLSGPGGLVSVTSLDTDPTVASPGPEPLVVANAGVVVTFVLTTGA